MIPESSFSLNSIASFSEEHVHIWKEPINQQIALGLLFDLWASSNENLNPVDVWQKIISRNTTEGFYVGSGLVLPHARVQGIEKSFLAFGVCPKGFEGVQKTKGEQATIMCLLLSPEKDPMIHMYVIKHIAQKLMDAQWKKRILNSLDAFEVKELLV